MPEPEAHPDLPHITRAARVVLVAGILIMAGKFAIFYLTCSAAVFSDAMESIINVVAAGFMLYSVRLSNRPADREHPYGHGKVEFMSVGLEGWLILAAGVGVVILAVRRFIWPVEIEPQLLTWGAGLLGGMGVLTGSLGLYLWLAGRKYGSSVLMADSKHLLTDFLSTVGVTLGLVLVRVSGFVWLDPLVALIVAALIFTTSWKLLWKSIDGLMDRTDPSDEEAIRRILDLEVDAGRILAYHKVRHRHSGAFHWVDLHLQVDGRLTVSQGHEIASGVEHRIEEALEQANATAHVEPYQPGKVSEGDRAATVAHVEGRASRPDQLPPVC